ncbi:MAG: aldehyde dehydrogenase family protein [Phycisphaerales bacterium]|nr:aldehyde dehydrogenase family protein [Phycisphaerales bacterium]
MTTILGAELTSMNPATGEPVGSVPVTDVESITGIVADAQAAQKSWAAMSTSDRINVLRRAVPLMEARKESIAAQLTAEMGKTLKESLGEISYGIGNYEQELKEIEDALAPEEHADGNTTSTLYHDPLGVCAAITPWNFPFLMPLQVVIPALAAGNTVVMKPSDETPLTGQAFAEIFMEILPANVLQVIHGGDDQGKALVKADVNLIAFVGSREAGQHILSTAGADLKRVVLELGGKDPMIVLKDADVDAAADFAVTNSFRNCGQVCVSTERIYVEEGIADVFEQAVIDRTLKLKIGDGATDGTTTGPMISRRQKDHVLAQLERAKQQGATVACGDSPADGNFVTPTVLTGLNHDMEIMRDETFGPVACIVRVQDADEAVTLANDTPYGLGAAVFGDTARAEGVARQLTAGMTGVNQGCGGATGTPWVGAQQSGYGYHSGRDGHRQFTQVRMISRPKQA